MIQDDKKNVWVTTLFGGINIIDLKENKIKHLNKQTGLSNDSLISIIQDNNKRIWIGGLYGKLDCINMQEQTITHYGTQQGLVKEQNVSLFSDAKNDILNRYLMPMKS